MAVTYPLSSAVVADTDATATQYNNLRLDAITRIQTLVAGENITELDPVYVKAADGKFYRAKSSTTAAETVCFGLATATVASGGNVSAIASGVMDGFSGMTVGSEYYMGASYGSLTTTEPTATPSVRVGIAISATTMLVRVQRTPTKGFRVDSLGFGFGTTPIEESVFYERRTLATATSYGSFLGPSLNTGVTGYNATWVAPNILAGVTVTNVYGYRYGSFGVAVGGTGTVTNSYAIYLENASSGTVTNSYFAHFSSAFLTGATTSTTHVDDVKVNTAGGLRYIRLYT